MSTQSKSGESVPFALSAANAQINLCIAQINKDRCYLVFSFCEILTLYVQTTTTRSCGGADLFVNSLLALLHFILFFIMSSICSRVKRFIINNQTLQILLIDLSVTWQMWSPSDLLPRATMSTQNGLRMVYEMGQNHAPILLHRYL